MIDAQAFTVTPPDRSYTAAIWFRRNDGGVHKTRFTSPSGDCVARAIAIATGIPYMKVHRELYRRQRAFLHAAFEREHGRRPDHKERGSGEMRRLEQPRKGALPGAYRPWLEEIGWAYTRTADRPQETTAGNGCAACGSSQPPEHGPRLGVDPLPHGAVIVETCTHACAVMDGVLHDIHTRAVGQVVTGYYQPPPRVNEAA
jgi:hypothetical protein